MLENNNATSVANNGLDIFGDSVGQITRTKVTVSLKTNEMLTMLASSIARDIDFRLNKTGNYNFSMLTKENLERYFKILIINRIKFVNQDKCLGMSKYYWKNSATLPSTIYILLQSIGIVRDEANGIEFVPTVNSELVEDIDDSEGTLNGFIEGMTAQLDSLVMVGQSKALVKGVPTNEEGDLDFMSAEIVAEELRSYRCGTTRQAVYRMFLESREIEQKFRNLMNVRYIDKANFVTYINEFARL